MKFGEVHVQRKVASHMRDGVKLYADVYRPDEEGEYPVLLMRQPYGRLLASTVTYAHPVWFAHQGYMVVIQDVRGRGDSEGVFAPFIDDVNDGYDTVEWAASLPHSNGKVGMYGFSYQGTTQWAAAAARPPHLKVLAPAMCAADLYNGMFYPHGRFAIGNYLRWSFQLARDEARRMNDVQAEEYCSQMMRDPSEVLHQLPILKEHPILKKYFPYYYDWSAHTTYDSYWEERNFLTDIVENPLPTLHIGGWFDNYLNGTLQTYDALHKAKKSNDDVFHRLIIGPWVHIPWGKKAGGKSYGPEADGNLHMEHLKWFDYWLKDMNHQLEEEPAIRYFELGRDKWKTANHIDFMEDSKQESSTSWYLASSGLPANGASGGGQLLPSLKTDLRQTLSDDTHRHDVAHSNTDVFVYDARLTMPCGSYLPQDRSAIQDRFEILNYTSPTFTESFQVAGSPKLSVWCQVLDGPTDLVAVLTIVKPDGSAQFLSIGRSEIPAQKNTVNDGAEEWILIEINLRPLAVEFQEGTALRVELTGSAFPLFAQHPNGTNEDQIPHVSEDELKMASIAIGFSEERKSVLQIPLVK